MFWGMLVFLSGYMLINLCIIGWFWLMLRDNRPLRLGSSVVLFSLCLLFPLLFKSSGNEDWRVTLLWMGAMWIGTVTYVFLLIFFVELVGKFKNRKVASCGFSSWQNRGRERYVVCGVVVGLSVLIAGVSYWMNANPVLNEHDLTIEVRDPAALRLPNNTLTVAVISDIHLGRLISAKRFDELLALAKPHRPDAVFLVGDILDDHIRLDVNAMRQSVEGMQARLGVWAVLGNHEYIADDVQISLDVFRDSGIEVLRDKWTVLDESVLLVGRDDYSKERFEGFPRATLEEILETVPNNYRDLPMIVLDHQPRHLEQAQNVGAKLQLSGHTHKGQIWPHSLALYFIYEQDAGHFWKGDTQYFISVGGASWGPPMRNTTRPEVLLLRLHFVKETPNK